MDDRVISQSDIGRQGPSDSPVRPQESTAFGRELALLREGREWSKADLAKRAGLDPSSITRFEQGSRNPDRETVLLLATSMVLPAIDRDRLLAAAGYRSEVWDDPMLVELAHILADRTLPAGIRDQVRSVVQMAIAYSRMKLLDPL